MTTIVEWNETNWKGRFFTVWGGQAVSALGSYLVQFALIWWLTQETGSATVLAIASLVAFLPVVVLGPFAGTLVDRWNRRVIMIMADSVSAVVALLLAYLFVIDQVSPAMIFILIFIRALGDSFHLPSMTAATSLMVPKGQLTRVQGLNQMLEGSLGIVSPPLGALLIGWMPMQGILIIDVVTFLAAIAPLFFIRIPELQKKPDESGGGSAVPSFWGEFRAGLRYVWSWPGLLILMLLAMMVNFVLTPAMSLSPLLIADHFGGDAFQLAWFNSSFGIGLVAGGLILGAWGGFKKRILTTMMGLIGLGIGFGAVGLLPPSGFWFTVPAGLFAGIMLPMVNGPVRAILQAVVEPDKQGRVYTLLRSAGTAMTPVGLLIAGPVADAVGVTSWFVIGGAGCALAGIASFFVPALLNIETGRVPASEEIDAQGAVLGTISTNPGEVQGD